MIIRFFYTVLLSFIAPFFLYGLFRKTANKPNIGARWKEHFGISPALTTTKQPIWIHAVSVGETIAVSPLIKTLKNKYPKVPILLTTTTPTGAAQADKLKGLVEHRYMPIDFSFAVKKFIRCHKPSQLLIVETELWPNTLHTVCKAKIPITVLNARLSDKSYRGYKKVLPIFRQVSRNISKILCQHQKDADNFSRLGVPQKKLAVTGSIKFDINISKQIIQNGLVLRKRIGSTRPVWIAASTHKGEDEIVLSAHKRALEVFPDALLILVPRHPERFQAVESLARDKFEVVNRTSQQPITSSTNVYIGNTMGEMLVLLGAADICFMGGSLIGKKVGGHNLLEPAALGKPCITGPSYYNFKDITNSLVAVNACSVIHDDEELCNKICYLLNNSNIMAEGSKQAIAVVKNSAGAIEATINQLQLH
ncbi:lipid IV(A) 3-deoxy-D-manno-octulosonic acid transferase [Vibrio sp. S4M6]|uniref:lipid IV(A) 3-deoxy-D-manno-octulosonic acid transferase n=1 Tax=Vibrio sinus TaxID=2946865 RepID=UPI002029C178|nr:lipid IV(A) 3-deoxy-D-manno-octulosonic acid transferase [Vibrio sinus]MCL9780362.1 lipid IV(A) 3-deoxy-D-manno-octulosonic acid transferase [Vibrio sinus]